MGYPLTNRTTNLLITATLAAVYGATPKLKATVDDLEDVPEAFRPLYTQDGDTFVLNIDGTDYKQKLNQFRENNVALKKAKEALESRMDKLKDIDPEEYERAKEALDFLDKDEEAKLLKAGKHDMVFEKRTKALKDQMQRQVDKALADAKKAQEESTSYKGKFAALHLDTTFGQLFNQHGVPKKGAMPDILRRVKDHWALDDAGNPTTAAVMEDGKPYTPEAWVKATIKDAAYFFEPSQGGGANGGQQKPVTGNGIKWIPNDPMLIGKFSREIGKGTMKVDVTGEHTASGA